MKRGCLWPWCCFDIRIGRDRSPEGISVRVYNGRVASICRGKFQNRCLWGAADTGYSQQIFRLWCDNRKASWWPYKHDSDSLSGRILWDARKCRCHKFRPFSYFPGTAVRTILLQDRASHPCLKISKKGCSHESILKKIHGWQSPYHGGTNACRGAGGS